MKGMPLILIASLLFLTASCNSKEPNKELKLNKHIKQIIFFSDEAKYLDEAAYYDALIELKKEFPNDIKNMKTLSPEEAKRYYDSFKVKHCPALIIIYKDEVVVKIDGDASKEGIVQPVSRALSKNF